MGRESKHGGKRETNTTPGRVRTHAKALGRSTAHLKNSRKERKIL